MGVVDYDHTAFELIGQIARTPIGLGVTSDSRFKTIQQVIAEAKEKPDSVRVAMNIGLLPHFVPLMFQQDALTMPAEEMVDGLLMQVHEKSALAAD